MTSFMGLYLREYERDEANERLHITLARLCTKTITKTKTTFQRYGDLRPLQVLSHLRRSIQSPRSLRGSGGLHPRLYSRGPSARCKLETVEGRLHITLPILHFLNREVKQRPNEKLSYTPFPLREFLLHLAINAILCYRNGIVQGSGRVGSGKLHRKCSVSEKSYSPLTLHLLSTYF